MVREPNRSRAKYAAWVRERKFVIATCQSCPNTLIFNFLSSRFPNVCMSAWFCTVLQRFNTSPRWQYNGNAHEHKTRTSFNYTFHYEYVTLSTRRCRLLLAISGLSNSVTLLQAPRSCTTDQLGLTIEFNAIPRSNKDIIFIKRCRKNRQDNDSSRWSNKVHL